MLARCGHPEGVIEVYQAEWCPYSHMVRQRLTELGVPFVARQVEPSPPQRNAMKEAVDSVIIPVVVLQDGTVLNGDAEEIVAELNRRFPETPYTAEHHERRVEARDFE